MSKPDMPKSLTHFAETIIQNPPKGRRRLVALAGPPASGKSTLAEGLVAYLNTQGLNAVLVPMDGFHLDNRILTPRGLLARKGAPETFDASGFVKMVQALAHEEEIVFPLFDRSLDCAIAGAGVVAAEHDTVVVEGNYLLLDQAPWNALAPLWDGAGFLSVPMEQLRQRLIERWLHHGLPQDAAVARAEGNDLANAKTVQDQSLTEGVTLIDSSATSSDRSD